VGWGLGEKIRELEVLLASEKKSERGREKESKRQGERNRDRPTTAHRRTNEEGRKTEKELWRERERGKVRSKRQKQGTSESVLFKNALLSHHQEKETHRDSTESVFSWSLRNANV